MAWPAASFHPEAKLVVPLRCPTQPSRWNPSSDVGRSGTAGRMQDLLAGLQAVVPAGRVPGWARPSLRYRDTRALACQAIGTAGRVARRTAASLRHGEACLRPRCAVRAAGRVPGRACPDFRQGLRGWIRDGRARAGQPDRGDKETASRCQHGVCLPPHFIGRAGEASDARRHLSTAYVKCATSDVARTLAPTVSRRGSCPARDSTAAPKPSRLIVCALRMRR